MIVGTVITAAQIPKAKMMAQSVKQHFPDSTVVVCLVEKSIHLSLNDYKFFDKVILAKDLEFDWPKLERIVFKYNATEAVCAVKGQFLKDLMKIYRKEDDFLYLDSEIKVFSPCTELFKALKAHSIIVTPHQLVPSDPALISREIQLLNEGTFHGGVIAISRTDDSARFVDWFADRLNRFYEDPHKGLYLDKKFLNLAMAAFDVHILRHPAYNVAVWNLHERLTFSADGVFHVHGGQLSMLNFSGLEQWQSDSGYDQSLLNEPWSYDFFNSGEPIARESRIEYRTNPVIYDQCPDLFAESNSIFAPS
jgi:hypothetical protein